MDGLYDFLTDYYITPVVSILDVFVSKSLANTIGNFLLNIPFMYYVLTPLWLNATGEDDLDSSEIFLNTVFMSWFITGWIYIIRGFGERELTGGLFLFGLLSMFGIIITWYADTAKIAQGINKSKKDKNW